MATSIRFIYFDLGNVLVFFDPEISCRKVADVLGVEASKVQEAMYESGIEEQLEAGQISETEFLQQLFDRCDARADHAEVLGAMGAMFWLNDSVSPVATKLLASGIATGILSNTCGPHWNWVMREGFGFVKALAGKTVLSYEAKSMKPDAKIYHVATEAAGCDGSEILFFDDRQENVDAAIACGWQAHRFVDALTMMNDLRTHGLDCFV